MSLNSSTIAAGATVTAAERNNIRKDIVQHAGDYATTGGSSTAYTITVDGQFTLVESAVVKANMHTPNGGTATLTVTPSGGAATATKTIKKNGGVDDVTPGDLVGICIFIYDGTYYQLVSSGTNTIPLVTVNAKENISAMTLVVNLSDVNQTIADTNTDFGRNASTTKWCTRFKPRVNMTISNIAFLLAKVGTPTDDVVIKIMTESSSLPSGTTITNGTSGVIAGGSVQALSSANDLKYETLTFATPPSLTGGTAYWIVIERSTAVDNSNYYLIKSNVNAPYADFTGAYFDGAVYTAADTRQMYFNLSTSVASISAWKADGSISALANWKGIALAAITSGSTGVVQTDGVVKGLSGLTADSNYYVGTAGAFSAAGTPNTYGGQVGRAISATTLLITKKRKITITKFTWASSSKTGHQVVEFGFRPTRIKITGILNGSGSANVSGSLSSVVAIGFEGTLTCSGVYFYPDGSNQPQGSVTDTDAWRVNRTTQSHIGTIAKHNETSILFKDINTSLSLDAIINFEAEE